MAENNFALCTSIYQRGYTLKNKKIENADEIVRNWITHSLLNEDKLSLSIRAKDISYQEYLKGISDLSEDDKNYLQRQVEGEKWYWIHNSVINHITENVLTKGLDLSFFTYPYRQWIEKKIMKISEEIGIFLSKKVYKKTSEQINAEFLSISLKTLVYDQNSLIEAGYIYGNDLLFEYLEYRFSSKAKYDKFFKEYPVLAKLLAERTIYFLDNIRFFLNTLKQEEKQIKEKWKVKSISQLDNICYAKGDSHNEGKAVLSFSVDNIKLVFKFKNLDIADRLQKFWLRLEQMDPEHYSFYKIDRIIGKNYTIETFVTRKSCNYDNEIKKYYYRFGQMILLLHILGGTDFHYENIIAVKDFPVIIDAETLFHNEKKTMRQQDALYNYLTKTSNSIVGTGLIPNAFGTDRCINISAISGGKQILPEKTETLSSNSNGRFFFTMERGQISNADNLPLLLNEPVYHNLYCNEIFAGFEQTKNFFLCNKKRLLSIMDEIFNGVVVRTIMRSTQKYESMLQFALHPSCMVNYINREKIFENLWDYPYKNAMITKYEIQDLLKNDIPIFFSKINSTSLISSNGEIIENVFEMSAWDKMKKRLSFLSDRECRYQKNILSLALQHYKGEKTQFVVDGEMIDIISSVTDKLIKVAVFGDNKETIILDGLCCSKKKQWYKRIVGLNYYNGLSGIYLYLLAYKKEVKYKTKKCGIIASAVENMISNDVDLNSSLKNFDKYSDYISILYLYIWRYNRNKDNNDLTQAYNLFHCIRDYYYNKGMRDDWIFGRAGLLKICTNLYLLEEKEEILSFIHMLLYDLNIQKTDCGFAHGYAGIIYSILYALDNIKGLYQVFWNKAKQIIEEFQKKLQDIMFINGSWCNGIGGIYIVVLYIESFYTNHDLEKPQFESKKKMLDYLLELKMEDDCLCHGNLGISDIFIKVVDTFVLKAETYQKIIRKLEFLFSQRSYVFTVRGLYKEPGTGLMDGICGIAYMFMRFHNRDLPSILFLDI